MKLALIAPHLYLRQEFAGKVIFSPGELYISLANKLQQLYVDEIEITSHTTGVIPELDPAIRQVAADDTHLQSELAQRGYDLAELFAKHPLSAITIARQMQTEIIAKAYASSADIAHVFMNEEELGLAFADLAKMPVVFTHHEPYNYLLKYRSVFAKYAKTRKFISISLAQRQSLSQANWVGNVHHGLDWQVDRSRLNAGKRDYFLYLGRIIEPKGVHLAIAAAKAAGVKLKIAGKHYAGTSKDSYWREEIAPLVDGEQIEYLGHISGVEEKQNLLLGARALLMPSIWEEPFGMVILEANSCGTPVLGLANGAISEIVKDEKNGHLVQAESDYARLVASFEGMDPISVQAHVRERYSVEKMARGYMKIYRGQM